MRIVGVPFVDGRISINTHTYILKFMCVWHVWYFCIPVDVCLLEDFCSVYTGCSIVFRVWGLQGSGV